MTMELNGLIAERSTARTEFIKARFIRDAASVYYDSVVTENAAVTQPAWDAFSEKQASMDLAGDRLILAHGAISDHALLRM
jgi:hypothetical protein